MRNLGGILLKILQDFARSYMIFSKILHKNLQNHAWSCTDQARSLQVFAGSCRILSVYIRHFCRILAKILSRYLTNILTRGSTWEIYHINSCSIQIFNSGGCNTYQSLNRNWCSKDLFCCFTNITTKIDSNEYNKK